MSMNRRPGVADVAAKPEVPKSLEVSGPGYVVAHRPGTAIKTEDTLKIIEANHQNYLAALKAGDLSTMVACDMEPGHLEILAGRVTPALRDRLACVVAKLPEAEFAPESFGAILCSRVLHFLTGEEIDASVGAMARWLRPGGRLWKATTFAPTRSVSAPGGPSGRTRFVGVLKPERGPMSNVPPCST